MPAAFFVERILRMENFDELNLKRELQEYIDENFLEEIDEEFAEIEEIKFLAEEKIEVDEEKFMSEPPPSRRSIFPEMQYFFGVAPDEIDFEKIRDEQAEETFSEKLRRLIDESGEKNSVIYNRANIDRRHFSKICNHKNYQPSKLTVLAFAIALKLNYEQTQELLAAAGYTLTKNNLADIIISFFIEKKIFDVDVVNNYLYDYEQPLLGG